MLPHYLRQSDLKFVGLHALQWFLAELVFGHHVANENMSNKSYGTSFPKSSRFVSYKVIEIEIEIPQCLHHQFQQEDSFHKSFSNQSRKIRKEVVPHFHRVTIDHID